MNQTKIFYILISQLLAHIILVLLLFHQIRNIIYLTVIQRPILELLISGLTSLFKKSGAELCKAQAKLG